MQLYILDELAWKVWPGRVLEEFDCAIEVTDVVASCYMDLLLIGGVVALTGLELWTLLLKSIEDSLVGIVYSWLEVDDVVKGFSWRTSSSIHSSINVQN